MILVDKVKIGEWLNILHSEIEAIENDNHSEYVSRKELYTVLKAVYSTIDAMREYIFDSEE